jgi:Amt family ammonium transporter
VSQITGGKPDLTMTINGILAGLVGVTAGCDGFSMPAAWVVGFIAGALVVWSVGFIDSLKIDDPVGAFSVHGVCGMWGTLAVGLFNTDKGLLTGHGFSQLGYQIVGVLAFSLFSIVTSLALWTGNRVWRLRGCGREWPGACRPQTCRCGGRAGGLR